MVIFLIIIIVTIMVGSETKSRAIGVKSNRTITCGR